MNIKLHLTEERMTMDALKVAGLTSLWILLGILAADSAYLFFLADCQLVKDLWFLTHTPGRCL